MRLIGLSATVFLTILILLHFFFAKEEGGGGEQNPQEIEDNEQLEGEQGRYFCQLLIYIWIPDFTINLDQLLIVYLFVSRRSWRSDRNASCCSSASPWTRYFLFFKTLSIGYVESSPGKFTWVSCQSTVTPWLADTTFELPKKSM